MNSQGRDEGNTSSGEASSQVNLLSMEFKLNLNHKLDAKIAALEVEQKELITKDAAWNDEMKARCTKMKEMKKEIKSCKIEIQELEKTRDSQRLLAKDLGDYIQLLKTDYKRYQEENIAAAKEQKEAIEDVENKWQIYQAGYETLPLAVLRTAERTALQKTKIELMVKKQRLAEMKEMIILRKGIDERRRKNLVVECAELSRESKIEDGRMCAAITARKMLEETLHRQEKMLVKLAQEQEQRLETSQYLATEKSKEMIISLLTTPQKRLLPIPRFELSYLGESLTQPMPTLTEDFDSISITSSVIDNLIEPVSGLLGETSEHDAEECNEITSDGPVDPRSEAIDVEEDRGIAMSTQDKPDSCASLRFEGMDEAEEAFERFETAVDKQQEKEEKNPSLRPAVEARATEEGFWERRDEELTKPEYWQASESQREEAVAQNCPSEIKRPRISRMEKVQLKLGPGAMETPRPRRENSSTRYFDASSRASVDSEWKANRPPSFYTYSGLQKEAEMTLGSELSGQSDDFLKKFHFSFSSAHGIASESMRSVDDNQTRFATSRATVAADPPRIGAPLQASGFLDMGVPETPTSRGNKKDTFFLSLF